MFPNLVYADQRWPKDVIHALADRISRSLRALGATEGGTVAAMMKNCPSYVATVIACRRAGIYLVSINWHFKAAEAGFLLEDSGAQILLIHADLLEQIASGIPNRVHVLPVPASETVENVKAHVWPTVGQAGEPLPESQRFPFNSVVYTSGTTGKPKGVRRLPVSPEDRPRMDANALQIAKTVYGPERASVALLSAPMYHSATMSFVAHACNVECTLVLEPCFHPERTLELIERYQVTHAYLVPTMYQRLLALPEDVRKRYDLSSLVQIASTGSPCPRKLKLQMIQWFGPIITEAYGSSEAGYTTFITSQEWMQKQGSAGRALGSAQLRILDAAGQRLPPGQVGLIFVKQPALADFTYIGREQDRQAIDRDGFITLGDMGYIDADGYLFICDRKSDMVISGGVNIYPAEVEAVLLSMPEIMDAAVFGIPDQEFGEAMAAAIELKPGCRLNAEIIVERLKQELANYKIPRTITFHASLPREDTGKVFKRLLKAPYWQGMDRRI